MNWPNQSHLMREMKTNNGGDDQLNEGGDKIPQLISQSQIDAEDSNNVEDDESGIKEPPF